MTNEKPRVLLVEDNADDRELAMLAFDEAGLRNQIAASEDASQALDRLRTWETEVHGKPHFPSVILLDIKLPGDDGFHVLQSVRANPSTRFLPVVMLSSSTEESDIARSYELGANSYLCKPVNFDHFVELARAIKEYWLQLNEVAPNLA